MRRANSEIGRWLEQKEKHSELLGGAGEIIQNTDNEQYLAMTLLDMSMNSSMAIGHSVAGDILKDLGGVTDLHKESPRVCEFSRAEITGYSFNLGRNGFYFESERRAFAVEQSSSRKHR